MAGPGNRFWFSGIVSDRNARRWPRSCSFGWLEKVFGAKCGGKGRPRFAVCQMGIFGIKLKIDRKLPQGIKKKEPSGLQSGRRKKLNIFKNYD
jgi:hypothetical protein